MIRWTLYLVKWVVCAVHALLALAYRVVLLCSKRGLLTIVPMVLLVVAYQCHDTLRDAVRDLLLEFRPGHVPEPIALDVLLVVLLTLGDLLYLRLTRMLSVGCYLLPTVLAAMTLILFRSDLHAALVLAVTAYPLRVMPEPIILDVIMVAMMVLGFAIYRPFAHLLAIVLGIFPPINWPLAPMPPLRVKPRSITAVRVRIVVPKPPRWHW